MDSISIRGGVALQGVVRIQGSKNAALPVLAATLLTEGISHIANCPRIVDVYNMISLLESLGCEARFVADGLSINPCSIRCGAMPSDAVTGMRSSLCLLGALLGSCGEVVMEHPGGCVIGQRPINLHLDALKSMGVDFEEKDGRLVGRTDRLRGADINLAIASVGATENIILAAVAAQGRTMIMNAAREPEIEALCDYLRRCGADIEGDGTSRIIIHGGCRLSGADYSIPADRIVAGTYLFACIATGGNVFLKDAPCGQMRAVLLLAERMGSHIDLSDSGIYVQSRLRPVIPSSLTTAPYPGFPTDLQSAALAAMLRGDGSCIIEENIFENRFRVVEPFRQMGADIEFLSSTSVKVRGVPELEAADVSACELRGGAALIIGGLQAHGESRISGCSYIYRGYENICRDLRELGARITIV
ncbi:MAG: UDP-N-acetylglucosamine 1-carboxyvinyltransferase [Lachnospiraceae bacterium]|nr:UDP-N-acetylglucosamine 1-carboxyvinyltransferase [Lachnospiraceae bacterium]